MSGARRDLTQQQAAELWARAAALQEEARRGAEDAIEARDDGHPTDAEAGTVSMEIARQAAVESGIDERFVASATFELAVKPHLDRAGKPSLWAKALDVAELVVTERTIVPASLSSVRAAVSNVMASDSFQCDPVEIVTPDDDHISLVYEVPMNIKSVFSEGSFHYQVRSTSEVRRLAVLITRLDDGQSELAVHATLDRSLRTNGIAMRVIQAITGVGAAVGAAFGASELLNVAGLSGGPLAAVLTGLVAAGVAGGVAAIVGRLFRLAYRSAHQKLRESFRKVLTAVRMRAEE
ncbi:MAG: hypothetical protein ACOC1U_01525 [Spirochaetota bacterium]